MILIKDIQFVIVLYKCRLEESPTFISLSRSLEKQLKSNDMQCDLYIYDNSPYAQDSQIDMPFWRLVYKSDVSNGGLSIAYNSAAVNARNLGKKYLLLLDQDTTFPEDTIKSYLDSINKLPEVKLFAPIMKIQNGRIMSPARYVNKWGKLIDDIEPGLTQLSAYVPVNSGLCIHLDSFFEVGGYNQHVKIDGADFQFIERFRRRNEQFYVINLIIQQEFSLFEEDFDKILNRYEHFLTDVRNFETNHWIDRFYYYRIIAIRTLKLFLKTKRLAIIKALFKNILSRNGRK